MALARKDQDPQWFLRVARQKAEASQYSELMVEMVEAIGDRRSRDLLDSVARCERDLGWSSAAELLSHASAGKYHPRCYSQLKGIQIEPLKYREMIFELMSCSGLEPVQLDVSSKLMKLSSEASFAAATREFSQAALDSARVDVVNGDTLFFDSSCDALPAELRACIEEQQAQEMKEAIIIRSGPKLDLSRVWSTEVGRRTLADLGIKGYTTVFTDEALLDVIQVSLGTASLALRSLPEEQSSDQIREPLNPTYRRLLRAIVNQDAQELALLGSSQSSSTLSLLIREALQSYERSKSTSDYSSFLSLLDVVILVRSTNTIQTLADIIRNAEPRVSIPAAFALSNFYHESAVGVLIQELCSSRKGQLAKTCSQALQYIHTKTSIAEPVIAEAIKSNCSNRVALKSILASKSWTSPGLEL